MPIMQGHEGCLGPRMLPSPVGLPACPPPPRPSVRLSIVPGGRQPNCEKRNDLKMPSPRRSEPIGLENGMIGWPGLLGQGRACLLGGGQGVQGT